MDRMLYCKNCGKRLDKTLICSACGTDYNEKPICDHFFTRFTFTQEFAKCSAQLHLQCEKCMEIVTLNCSEGMLFDLLDSLRNGRI